MGTKIVRKDIEVYVSKGTDGCFITFASDKFVEAGVVEITERLYKQLVKNKVI